MTTAIMTTTTKLNYHNKTPKKRRRIFVRHNLFFYLLWYISLSIQSNKQLKRTSRAGKQRHTAEPVRNAPNSRLMQCKFPTENDPLNGKPQSAPIVVVATVVIEYSSDAHFHFGNSQSPLTWIHLRFSQAERISSAPSKMDSDHHQQIKRPFLLIN